MIAALTGGMGCGKSLVLKFFSEMDWFTLSADAICHQIYAEHNEFFFTQLESRWGKTVFCADGSADKRQISAIVFGDEAELAWLNGILHPLIMRRGSESIAESSNKYIMFEIPLLFEAKLDKDFSPVICVWSSHNVQMARLLQRQMPREQLELRLANQIPVNEKLEKADFGLINNSQVELLYEQCKIINDKLRN
jgi:dephospho-CoA kinase